MVADPIQAFSDYILTGVGGAITLVAGYARRVDSTATTAKDTAERVERRQIGDPDDPNAEGVLQMAADTRKRTMRVENKIDHLEERMEQQHRMLMDEVKSMRGENGEFYRGGGSEADD